MTPEERKTIMAYWKDRPDVPFDVLEEFNDALDARDVLLREVLEVFQLRKTMVEAVVVEAKIRALLVEKP